MGPSLPLACRIEHNTISIFIKYYSYYNGIMMFQCNVIL